ncbi:sensor histidine kinase [Azohydromonas lata]|uniref:histidine kinase n=1 Tax=Azohydromonas lata TaxID=45677 RepID=A0ABU5IQY5_9BURK|nr:sensor histidine kinase N-terminal domain-containing protein [Azohydromonas lata]MDZ5461315.1 sensor histidine kinase N-terminal domain-containing protein [Azohydromonas lata]
MPSSGGRALRLKRELLLRLMLPLLAIVGATALLGTVVAQRFTDRVYDRWLLDAAHSLSRQVRFDAEGRASLELPPAAETFLTYDEIDRTSYAVEQDGHHVGGHLGVPQTGTRLRRYDHGMAFDATIDGQAASVARVEVGDGAGHSAVALVGETVRKRVRTRDNIVLLLAPVALLAGMAAVGAIVWGVRRSIRPLEAIAARWNERSHRSLQPIPAGDVPRELMPFATALNDLLQRIRNMLARERQFAATAAHQLRTPLTGLQLGLARASEAPDLESTRRVLRELEASTQRSARMVQQLLSLGRLDPELRGALECRTTDLVALAADVGSSFIDRADHAGITLELIAPEQPLRVAVQAELMSEALGNLLDNALRYCKRGGRVWIAFETSPPALLVCDDGPGVPQAEREQVFERFVRGAGVQVDGSGLGLAIVREIAELHGASVFMGESEAGGACVTMRFDGAVAAQPG